MPLSHKGLLFETRFIGILCRELGSDMSVHITLKFLCVSTVRVARSREGIPTSSSLREEMI